VQSQSWHEKEKYDYDTQLDEEQQNQSAEFFFVDFEELPGPRSSRVPEQSRRREIKQREYEPNDKGAEEKLRRKIIFSRSIRYIRKKFSGLYPKKLRDRPPPRRSLGEGGGSL
jgi:hypothetical protein